MKHRTRLPVLFVLLGAFLAAAACSGLGLGTLQPEPLPPRGQYLDFDDVQVPTDLKLDNDASFVYETAHFRAGVLGLTGDMDTERALKYFEDNMPRDGWAQLSSIKFRKNILIYTKPEKVCLIIAANPGGGRTKIEVWVSPNQSGRGTGTGYPAPGGQQLEEETIKDTDGSS